MATAIVVKNEPTRKVILGALWEHLTQADGKVDEYSGLYGLLSDGFRPEATLVDYRAACDRFDALITFLTSAREDIGRVEIAELGTTVTLRGITRDGLAGKLDSYRAWIEDTKEGLWTDRVLRQDLLDRHDAITALLPELAELAVA